MYTVLVIETDPCRRRLYRQVLANSGFHIRPEIDADDIASHLRVADLVLLGSRPGDMAARASLTDLCASHPHFAVVAQRPDLPGVDVCPDWTVVEVPATDPTPLLQVLGGVLPRRRHSGVTQPPRPPARPEMAPAPRGRTARSASGRPRPCRSRQRAPPT